LLFHLFPSISLTALSFHSNIYFDIFLGPSSMSPYFFFHDVILCL
jgi:hypothetical protein